MEEIWKDIPGFPGYQVSDLGQIKSFKKSKSGKLLSQSINAGYPFVHILNKDGHYKMRRVHILVMLAFVGPPPDGMEVCHINDIKNDNRLENLKYATHIENTVGDAIRNNDGVHPKSSLSKAQVEAIISDLDEGLFVQEIAQKYNTSQQVVSSIFSGSNYSHIPRPESLENPIRKRANKIRGLYSTGNYTYDELAEMFNISISGVSRIVNHQRASDKEPVYPQRDSPGTGGGSSKMIYFGKDDRELLKWCNEQTGSNRYSSFSFLVRDALRCLRHFNQQYGDWRQVPIDCPDCHSQQVEHTADDLMVCSECGQEFGR